MAKEISCPISPERINENVARIAAGYTILFTILSIVTGWYVINLLLAIDFGIRSFTTGSLSILRFASIKTARLFSIKNKPVDAAPKKFAAGVGMFFCLVIAVSQILHIDLLLYIFSGMLLVCAFLESAFGYCVGCVVYTFLTGIRKIKLPASLR